MGRPGLSPGCPTLQPLAGQGEGGPAWPSSRESRRWARPPAAQPHSRAGRRSWGSPPRCLPATHSARWAGTEGRCRCREGSLRSGQVLLVLGPGTAVLSPVTCPRKPLYLWRCIYGRLTTPATPLGPGMLPVPACPRKPCCGTLGPRGIAGHELRYMCNPETQERSRRFLVACAVVALGSVCGPPSAPTGVCWDRNLLQTREAPQHPPPAPSGPCSSPGVGWA